MLSIYIKLAPFYPQDESLLSCMFHLFWFLRSIMFSYQDIIFMFTACHADSKDIVFTTNCPVTFEHYYIYYHFVLSTLPGMMIRHLMWITDWVLTLLLSELLNFLNWSSPHLCYKYSSHSPHHVMIKVVCQLLDLIFHYAHRIRIPQDWSSWKIILYLLWSSGFTYCCSPPKVFSWYCSIVFLPHRSILNLSSNVWVISLQLGFISPLTPLCSIEGLTWES